MKAAFDGRGAAEFAVVQTQRYIDERFLILKGSSGISMLIDQTRCPLEEQNSVAYGSKTGEQMLLFVFFCVLRSMFR
jgi:hypothetical protein